MCNSKQGEPLYAKLKDLCQQHLIQVATKLMADGATASTPPEFLALISGAWRTHCDMMVRWSSNL
jgi:hypothetical protein